MASPTFLSVLVSSLLMHHHGGARLYGVFNCGWWSSRYAWCSELDCVQHACCQVILHCPGQCTWQHASRCQQML